MERFVRGVGGSNSENILSDKKREDQRITKSGPSWAFRWRADDDPTLNVGVFFSGDPDQYC